MQCSLFKTYLYYWLKHSIYFYQAVMIFLPPFTNIQNDPKFRWKIIWSSEKWVMKGQIMLKIKRTLDTFDVDIFSAKMCENCQFFIIFYFWQTHCEFDGICHKFSSGRISSVLRISDGPRWCNPWAWALPDFVMGFFRTLLNWKYGPLSID